MADIFEMREPCKKCGSPSGYVTEIGAQDVVRCSRCNVWNYNRPRTESGKAVRSVKTTHEAVSPKQRARVLLRANGNCELCGKSGTDCEMHIGHLISVKSGHELGMTDHEINDDENMCAMCSECNLGVGDEPMPLRYAMKLLRARYGFGKKK